MKNLAIFASGNGSNFDAIAEAIDREGIEATISLLVCDHEEAYVIQRAQTKGIETFIFEANEYPSKAAFELEILNRLIEKKVELIILAGYMRLVGSTLLSSYGGRIVNIHPSILPSFPGKDAIGQAFNAKVTATGVTVHYVDEGMDTGPIIAQQEILISEADTELTLKNKVQAVEHHLYPAVIKQLCSQQEEEK